MGKKVAPEKLGAAGEILMAKDLTEGVSGRPVLIIITGHVKNPDGDSKPCGHGQERETEKAGSSSGQ